MLFRGFPILSTNGQLLAVNALFHTDSPWTSAVIVAVAAGLLLWAFWWISSEKHKTSSGRGTPAPGAIRPAFLALCAILLLAFQTRWQSFKVHSTEPLDPDAAGFLEIVRQGGGLYETAASAAPWVREPAWIWLNRVAAFFFGAEESTLRLVSLLAGLALVAATARLGAMWFGTAIGLAAAAGMALSPQWAEWSARGLRTDWYALLVVGFVIEWERAAAVRTSQNITDGDNPPPRRFTPEFAASLRMGALAALANLTYISAISWTLPFLAWRAWRTHWRLAPITVAFALAILPLLPHLAFNYRFHNSRDPFFSSNIHARFYRNYEALGQWGGARREEFYRDPYGGPPVTTLGYVLGGHNAGQLLGGSLAGAWKIFVYRAAGIQQFGASKVLTALYLLGIAAAVFLPAGRRAILLWLWLGAPFLFIASLRHFDLRLAAHLTPWMWMFLALGIAWAIEGIRRIAPMSRNPREPRPWRNGEEERRKIPE